MNFLPLLTTWQFAAAGLVLAAGPVVIHLLNRRRFRVVHWAAMEFLREAMQRSRRMMRLRDVLLLVMRTLVLILLGLALAQPYLATNSESFDGRTRLHAILLIDNSLSMGLQALDGTLLDRAKRRATEYVESLPPGSLVSVLPLCGSQQAFQRDPYPGKQQALAALEAIPIVDRSTNLINAVNLAVEASETAPDVAKRVVLFSDQQRRNWQNVGAGDAFADLPSLQLVDVASPTLENAWVDGVWIQDGVADVESPSTIVASLRYVGSQPSRETLVTLSVGGRNVSSRSVRLDSGAGAREVSFQHVFDEYDVAPGRSSFAPVTVSITPDALAQDDVRSVVVPVVASLPVVFVDQYGADEENPLQGRLGETRHLRQLLAPTTSRDRETRQLVEVRHVRLDQLNRELIADARMVVLAGLRDPGSSVELLREYAQQGGQLVIAAGGEFDPAAWNRSAWLNGKGILPTPLSSELVGALPSQADAAWQPFTLDFRSMQTREEFVLAGNSEQDLRDLYEEPLFFQAVGVDLSSQMRDALLDAERTRFTELWRLHEAVQKEQLDVTGGSTQATDASSADNDERDVDNDVELSAGDAARELRRLHPEWLLWRTPVDATSAALSWVAEHDDDSERWIETQARAGLPTTLASFDRQERSAFLVQRRVGDGQILFVSSGLLSEWNTIARTNAFVLFDRLLRQRIYDTLPTVNYATSERITVTVPRLEKGLVAQLRRPNATDAEYLDLGFLGSQSRGVVIERAYDRGLYQIDVSSPDDDAASDAPLWSTTLAVAGNGEESDLTPLSAGEFSEQVQAGNVRWIGEGEPISLAGAQVRGRFMWRLLLAAVLMLLLTEMAVLAWSSRFSMLAGTSSGAASGTPAFAELDRPFAEASP